MVRLNSINQLKEKFSNIQIGLSDHTQSNISAIGAISLGATIIEKHFVDKKTRKGPDISSSMDENQLKDLIKDSEIIFRQIKGDKKSLKEVFENKGFKFVKSSPMILDAYYVSLLSESYKKSTFKILKSIFVGTISNTLALFTKEYSSNIFVFKKLR